MHLTHGTYIFLSTLSTNQKMLVGIAALLVIAAAVMLLLKFRNSRKEAKFANDNDDVLASLFPDLQPAVRFTAAAPSPEPARPVQPAPVAAKPVAPAPAVTYSAPPKPAPEPAPIATYITPKPVIPEPAPIATYITPKPAAPEPAPIASYSNPPVKPAAPQPPPIASYINPPKPVEPEAKPAASYITPPSVPAPVGAPPVPSYINPPVVPPAERAFVNPPVAPNIPPVNDKENEAISEINAVLNSLSDILFEFDEAKVCVNLWYNREQKFVIDPDKFRGKRVFESMGRENAKLIAEALDYVSANGISTSVEFQSYYASGRWFQAHVSPVYDGKKEYSGRNTVLITENTAQKKLVDEIKENQQRLLAAQKVARLGDWSYDIATKQTIWSENLYAILDIEHLPRNIGHFEYYASKVMSEDRRSVYQFFGDMTGAKGRENHHRIVTDGGTLKYFRIVRGDSVKDESGKVIKINGIIQDVSEYQSFERNIKQNQAELDTQAASVMGNWKWNPLDGSLAWSDEVYQIFETSRDTIKNGLDHVKMMMRTVHPADRMILMSFLKNPASLHRTSYEYRMITPSGKVKYLSLVVSKIRNGEDGSVRTIAGTLQDISARKQAELNIKQSEDNYKLVLETIKLAAISVDRNGNIIFCNKFLSHLLGYQQKNLIGLNWYKQFISENLKPVMARFTPEAGLESNYVNPVICKDGEERVISWQHTTVYDDNGQVKQITSIGEDVTDQQKSVEGLIAAKEKAEKASMYKSEFLSTMSHEIRTPMNSVIGTTNLLLEENPRPDQLAYLNSLKFSGENLLGIIDDILDYNKIEAGKLELSKATLNIVTLVNNIKQSFYAKAAEKRIGLHVEMDAKIPQHLVGDPIRIGQILNNLVSNAVKFTHHGGVTITVREEGRASGKVRLNFVIADTGIGIEPQSLDKIFEPFEQESKNQQSNYGGTGLGLAIVKRLVELHGSTVKVSSVQGRGTQFTFSITFDYKEEPVAAAAPPIQPVANTATANAAPKPTPAQNATQKMQDGDLTGMRILVVDDNKMNILIASRFLSRWNVTISEANNGLMATEMADANEYDLIIMDLQMPIMDGFEATKIIKSRHPRLPIIALTADAMPETFAKTRNCGMDDYLTKPFMPEILFEKIARHYKVAVV